VPEQVTTKLQIPQPSEFYCEADEEHFFGWLGNIKAVESFQGTANGLCLTLADPIDRSSFYELVGLLARYSIDMSSLRSLCETNPDEWFRRSENYWYQSVFAEKS